MRPLSLRVPLVFSPELLEAKSWLTPAAFIHPFRPAVGLRGTLWSLGGSMRWIVGVPVLRGAWRVLTD